MPDQKDKITVNPAFEPEKTVTKTVDIAGRDGLPMRVDVKNGKIIRIRPLHFDEKYSPEHIQPWKIQARGKILESHMKSLPYAFQSGYKKRVYSPNRILYPLKRVDWDPNGERNPQNRGKSKFKRISWDEATDIIVSEIKRIHTTYGPFAILCQGDEIGHGESKKVHKAHGCHKRLLGFLGGYTDQVRNADSAEGWYWGSKHVWGDMMEGFMLPQTNCIKDICENTDMILYSGCDFETTPKEKDPVLFDYFYKELGIKRVFVCPDVNYSAAVHADKWIPIIPNTDAALYLAIAYVWLTEGTYDKEYVQTHTFGIEKFADYVLGKEDGVPKTPAWASPITGITEWTINALASQWAKKKTSILEYGGGKIRGPYSSEPARLEVLLLAMQGIGKPGIHQCWPVSGRPAPLFTPNLSEATPFKRLPWMKQLISKVYIHKAILNPPVSHWGKGRFSLPLEDQFIKYNYPIPREEGGTEIHMMWTDHPSWIGNWNHGNLMIQAWRSPKIEFVLAQHQWMENDCLFADLILPINTMMEEDDVMTSGLSAGAYHTFFVSPRAIEPIGESKSDYEAVGEIAKKLGLYDKFTNGKTVEEKIRHTYETSGVEDFVSYEDLQKKGYFVVPTMPDWDKVPAGMKKFADDPEHNPLHTKSGKIEFYGQWLAEHFPDDRERPPVPHWIPGGPGWTHDESLLGERAKKYPLLVISNHPHWRHHVQCDDISWTREIQTCKIKGPDGYLYEPVWMNPVDANKRGIKHGDIVKLFNERGAVLSAAYVTERVISGAVMQDHGARTDEIISPGLDRGGNHNLICPDNTHSQNCTGQATNNFLVEIQKVNPSEMAEWREKYPTAFQRDYNPDSGLTLNSWLEE